MSSQHSYIAPVAAPQKESVKSTRGFATLFWLVAGIPLAAVVLAFPLVCSPLFVKYADKYGPTAVRPLFATRNAPCDILMTGDSTSLVGLDPRVIQEVTHLTACNIGATFPVLAVNGLDPVDRYLERNPRPKFLVLQFSGSSFVTWPTPNLKSPNIEGIIPLLRYVSPLAALRLMVKAPDTFIGLVHYVYVLGAINLRQHLFIHKYERTSKELGGYTVMPFPPLKTCPAYDAPPITPENLAWIRLMRSRYAGKVDHLMVDVSPTSICNRYYSQWNTSLSGQVDNQLDLYPLSDFVDSNFHLTRDGAVQFSNETARNILAISQQQPSSGSNPPRP